MTDTIIHDRGRTLIFKQPKPKFADPTISAPRERQRPRGTWKGWREAKMPKEHNGYKPGFVYDLGPDQCRFIPGDDYRMCGAKNDGVSSYCEKHHALVVAPPRVSSPKPLHGCAAQTARMTSAYKIDDPLDEAVSSSQKVGGEK
jgi:hypothetical protein